MGPRVRFTSDYNNVRPNMDVIRRIKDDLMGKKTERKSSEDEKQLEHALDQMKLDSYGQKNVVINLKKRMILFGSQIKYFGE